MTLEQIKFKQNEINESLYILLQSNTQLVDSIVGVAPEEARKTSEASTNGLVSEILNLQEATDYFIQRLNENNRRLFDQTFNRAEMVQDCKAIVYER